LKKQKREGLNKMNILFGKNPLNNESNDNKDDSFVLQSSKETKTNENDDDDLLILTSTNNDKQTKNPTLLTQTVQQLFGKTSSSSTIKTKDTDEKIILDQNTTDEQLIDLN